MKRITLYCFPFAGGSAAAYNRWRQFIGPHIDLEPVELAGRGKRIYEPVYETMNDAVEDVLNMISTKIFHIPYAFFGHSMGGIIAYQLARRIREKNMPGPRHIFFSGRSAPHVARSEDEEIYYQLPDDQFKEKIIELGGTPKEFFEHPELLQVILPMIRSDFKLAETYEHSGEIVPFDHDITVLLGKDEDITADEFHGWRELTSKICKVHFFEGEHFFINDQTEKVVQIVNRTLLERLHSSY